MEDLSLNNLLAQKDKEIELLREECEIAWGKAREMHRRAQRSEGKLSRTHNLLKSVMGYLSQPDDKNNLKLWWLLQSVRSAMEHAREGSGKSFTVHFGYYYKKNEKLGKENALLRGERDGLASMLTSVQSEAIKATLGENNIYADFVDLICAAVDEAGRASRKFPQPNYVISKIAEEAGEVVKAAIHTAEGREQPQAVRDEMKQLIAMLYRLWTEGDQVHGLKPLRMVRP